MACTKGIRDEQSNEYFSVFGFENYGLFEEEEIVKAFHGFREMNLVEKCVDMLKQIQS